MYNRFIPLSGIILLQWHIEPIYNCRASFPRTKGATNERQPNIEELLKDVRNDKKGKKNDKCGARK